MPPRFPPLAARHPALQHEEAAAHTPSDGAAWTDAFVSLYRDRSRRNQERRLRRRQCTQEPSPAVVLAKEASLAAARERIAARFAEARQRRGFAATHWQFVEFQARAGDPDARLLRRAEYEPFFAERRRERRAFRQACIRQRLAEGFHWPGGEIGGNPAYRRDPFIYHGLVSDEHPILQLFVASTPRPPRLRTGRTKAEAAGTDSKVLALDSAYVNAGKAMRRVLRVELDRVFAGGFEALARAVGALGVPLPNLAVGHVDGRGHLLSPHLIWLIADSVPFTARGQRAQQDLWQAVLRGLTAALLPLGADPGGTSNPLRVKNPLSPLWHRAVLAEEPYSLTTDARPGAPGFAALVPDLDLAGAGASLRAATGADREHRPVAADHPDPTVAGGSNRVFRGVRDLARRRVVWHRDQGNGTEEAFLRELVEAAMAMVLAGEAAARAAALTACSVARWTWKRYRPARTRQPCATPEERRAWEAAGQAKGAATRRGATLAALVEAARRIAAAGERPTQAAVAGATGRSERTVRNHWPAVLAALAAAHAAAG